MGKPITIVCAALAGLGLLLLGSYSYYALSYGDFEAGNYHRCRYWVEPDITAGKVVRRWEQKWELMESTEGFLFFQVDVWLIGTGLLFLSAGIWVSEWSGRRQERVSW